MRRIPFSALIVLPLAFAVSACGSSSKSSAPTPASGAAQTSTTVSTTAETTTMGTPAGGPAITIEAGGSDGFLFMTSASVRSGTEVTVKNTTGVQHTVSADTAAGGFDVTIDPGKTATFTAPAKPGAYKFHCNIHTFMTGTLTVT